MGSNPIKLIEPLAVAIYFFIAEMVAVYISAEFGGIGRLFTDMVREHIAPKSFYFVGGITLFVSYIYSLFRKLDKPRDSQLVNIAIIAPANFVCTLGFIAVAIAWGEHFAMHAFSEFTIIPKESYMPVIKGNAISISVQVAFLWLFLRSMYINTNELDDPEHVINALYAFWFCMLLMTVFFVSFWGCIGYIAFSRFA